ncbi:MAG: histidinol dehydrogenase, partial [Chloroflexales bacterium]|nr:histidinol dehydrogenase [Chloroflexales bacterium]
MTIPIISDLKAARAGVLRRAALDEDPTVMQVVEATIQAVRQHGDAALHDLTLRFDGVDLQRFEVPRERWEAATQSLAPDLLNALHVAVNELERFHRRQVRNSWVDFNVEGALGQLVVPIERVGVYVPGGAAPLPSSLLHAAVPARVAGVGEIVVCAPPQRASGEPDAVILAAAYVAGVQRLFALGGAQAIAAMAYGTETVPKVDKIVGPGNRYVILAKKAVFGTVGIESLPGPTETLVIADAQAEPRYVAADLLAQAEHYEASAILLTPSTELAAAVQAEVAR